MRDPVNPKEWQPEEEEFFTATAGRDSNTETVSFRLSAKDLREMDEIVAEARAFFRLPYRTRTDLFRDAVIHRMIDILPMMVNPQSVELFITQQRLLNKRALQEEAQRNFKNHISFLEKSIPDYLSSGPEGKKEAERLLSDCLVIVNRMSSNYWRRRYLDELNHICPGLMREINAIPQ